MADEYDQETADGPDSPVDDLSPREPYRALLARLHDAGDLDDAGYERRVGQVATAATWGDLEGAVADLDRGPLPIPTRRKQRRELPVEETAEPEIEESADELDELDDEPIVLEGHDTGAVEDDDLEDEDLDDEEDLVDDEDLDADEDLVEDEDDALDDEDDLDDLDEDDEPPAKSRRSSKAVATRTGKSVDKKDDAKKAAATTAARSKDGGKEKKGRPTPKRPTAVAQAPRTGPIQFIKESVEELRKVVYPTSAQLWTYFAVVLMFVLFVIGYTSGLDYGFGQLMLLVFGQ